MEDFKDRMEDISLPIPYYISYVVFTEKYIQIVISSILTEVFNIYSFIIFVDK